MPDRVTKLLSDLSAVVREAAVKIAGHFGFPECRERLLACCHDSDEAVRRAALGFLPTIDPGRALSILGEALLCETPVLRAAAASTLGQMENPRTFPYLLAALEDPDAWVREHAAQALGRLGMPEAAGALERLVRMDPASQVRVSAVESLGRVGGPQAVAALAPLTTANDLDLVQAAATALGRLHHADALLLLLPLLHHPNPGHRMAAATALGDSGDATVVRILADLAVLDRDPKVIRAAVEALGRLAAPEAVRALLTLASDRTRREICLATLAHLDETSVAQGLSDDQPAVRSVAVEALSRMRTSLAHDLIAGALEDSSSAVRLIAIRAVAHSDPASLGRSWLASPWGKSFQ
jgi:HEAT repeat protein